METKYNKYKSKYITLYKQLYGGLTSEELGKLLNIYEDDAYTYIIRLFKQNNYNYDECTEK